MSLRSSDLTAPGFEPDAVGLPWYRRALRQGGGYTLPSTLFVAIPLFATWGHVSGLELALVALQCAVMAGLYAGTTLVMHWSHGQRWAWLGALMLAVLSLAWSSSDPSAASYYTAYVAVAAAMLLPWYEASRVIAFSGIAGILLAAVGHNPYAGMMAVVGGLIGYSVGSGINAARVRQALTQAEQRTAVLAVAAERERIGRDLHDILGHSLTTIAVKADLARRLVDRDPAAAASEIASLAAIARQSLADVRATASGMKEVRLASEVASARSVLVAAGLECRTPSALPTLTDERSELFGYVVREAVTNVVRHAGASVATIEVGPDEVSVGDDGAGMRRGQGNGLAGLTTRIQDAGGRLAVESGPTGTRVTASFAADEGER